MAGRLAAWLSRIKSWWLSHQTWWLGHRDSADLDVEIGTHVSLLAAEYERRGMSPEVAEREAKLAFGGLTQFKEDQRDRRGLPWLEALLQDVRYGVRAFVREPGFTVGAIVTLAIGIGANTAVFGLLNGYLRPLPVPDAGRVVAIGGETRGDENALSYALPYATLADLRARPLPFSDLLAFTPWIGGLTAGGRTTSALFSGVTDNFFSGLRLEPALGRLFAPGDGEHPGSARLVVLGYTSWQHRFGGDPSVLNTRVRINGEPATIIGVAPKGFFGMYAGTDMAGYLTIDTLSAVDPTLFPNVFTNRELHTFTLYGRLRPGVSLDAAQQAVDNAAREIERDHPDTDRQRGLRVFPERLARPFPQRSLASAIPVVTLFLLALAALVLGLACLNVSNLVFVRSLARQREMAVRAAIGASRARLVRQALTESLLLAAAGGVAGVLVGQLGQRLFVAGIDLATDFTLAVNAEFDWRVFLYALGAVTAAGVVVGLWPALRASRIDPSAMLHDGGRGFSGGLSGQRVRRALAVVQLGGALMLLTVAGLFVQHLRLVQHLDLGFDAERVLNARLDPRQVGYDAARTSAFYAELERRVRSWPEVESASLAFSVPLGYFSTAADIFVDGRLLAPNEPAPSINFNRIGTDYFKTMGIPILEGRAIRDADRGPSARVAVVNKTMADLLWPGQEAIGRTFRLDKQDTSPWRVVGVARDSKYVLIFEQPRPYFYVPIEQREQSMRVLQLRSSVPPASLAPRLDREIHALDPDMPVADLQTMQASLSGAMGLLMYRLGSYQAAALGGLGLLLAIVGVYGVVSHGAQQRTREIGIRIALGAHPTDVRRLILTQGLWIVAAGLLLGAGASAGAARVMEQFFTLATPSNLAVDVGIALGLAAIALGACYIPARRAMRVDPMVVLRHE